MKAIFTLLLIINLFGCSGVGVSRLVNLGDEASISKLSYEEINEVTFDSTPLSRFILYGDGDISKLEMLLRNKADPNIKILVSPIITASIQNNEPFIKALIKYGADVNQHDYFNNTPLHYAIHNKNSNVVKLLLEHGAKTGFLTKNYPPESNNNGLSELSKAVVKGDVDSTKLLLAFGADPNLSDENKIYPLTESAFLGDLETARALLSAGANPNLTNKNGATPLMFAVLGSHVAIVQTLLQKGATPDTSWIKSTTPLQEAAFSGNKEIVQLLISAGASVNARNSSGFTAMQFAQYNNHPSVIDTLISAGAEQNLPPIRLTNNNDVKATTSRQEPQPGSDNSNLWATAFVGILNVAANLAYPNSTYRPSPVVYMPSTQPTYVAPTPTGCTSDFACGVGMQCVKPPLSSTGQCMKPVDSYGAPLPGSARPGSSLMNTSPVGQCTTTTDCPIGFRCDSTLKACVK